MRLHSVAVSSCIGLDDAIDEVLIKGRYTSMKMKTRPPSSSPTPAPIKQTVVADSPAQTVNHRPAKESTPDPEPQPCTGSIERWTASPWSPISHSSISLPSASAIFRQVQLIENEDDEVEYLHTTHPEAIEPGHGDVKPQVRPTKFILSIVQLTYIQSYLTP